MHWMRRLRRRLGSERGMVLPLAVFVLVAIGLLAALVVDSAVTANQQSNVQINRRIALQNADSGLQAAIYRLSQVPWNVGHDAALYMPNLCFTTVPVSTTNNSTGDQCSTSSSASMDVTDSLGSMGSYTYHISSPLSQTGSYGCTGWWVNPGGAFGGVTQRCITATGTYNGVTRRVQERVAAENWVFPVNGILSLGAMLWDTSGSQYLALNGTFQSNGLMTIGTGTQNTPDDLNGAILQSAGGYSFGPGEHCGAPYNTCLLEPQSQPFPRPDGPTATDYQKIWSSTCGPSGTSPCNNDAALTTGVWAPGGKPVYSASTGAFAASGLGTPAKPTANPPTQWSPVIMPAGTYIFCSMSVSNSAIETQPGGQVTIYIDSPAVDPSHCGSPSYTGTCPKEVSNVKGITMSGSGFYNPTGIAGNLQIFVYGNPGWTLACPLKKGDPGQVSIENVGNPLDSNNKTMVTVGELYAPDSYMTTTGAGIWWGGGIVVGGLESNDFDIWGFVPNPPTQAWYPTAWTVCPSGAVEDPGCS